MESVHNPDRYMADLRLVLSQGRKRIGLLVGAGGPMSVRVNQEKQLDPAGSPLIPGVQELTDVVIDGIADGIQRAAAQAIRKELGPSANVETVLSKVRLLEQALGTAERHALNGEGFGRLGKVISARIATIVRVGLPEGQTSYSEFVSWVTGANRTHAVEIFTTNYDLLFEEALERVQTPYFDGFSGGAKPFFDAVSVAVNDLPPRWSRLWKLHGSLGWRIDQGRVIRAANDGEAQLIYPDHLKYDLTQKQPYSALFERLKQFLSAPDTLLLVAGFSFGDAHVSAVVDDALATNSNAAVFAFQFGQLAQQASARALGLKRPNVSVFCQDRAVIGGVEGPWRVGQLPKGWEEIRASYWDSGAGRFLLGDFKSFCRFCALAQSADLRPEVSESLSQGAADAIKS